jgi:copper resistance protein D
METPSSRDLSPVGPIGETERADLLDSFLPGQRAGSDSPADIAWSEYNHHWAGLVVLAIGILSLLARRLLWARNWPLAFLGLALFLFIRADAENWPLGPRGFRESFQVAEVAQHRLFVALIVLFAIFEWSVQRRRTATQRAGLVFPLVCAAGGALLLTHSHFVHNVRKEYFAEISHVLLAMLAVVAGWSRWLEIRLPARKHESLIAWVWPVWFVLIGAILIAYREI